MNRRRTLLAMALCLSLVVLILAQEKRPKSAGPTVAPPPSMPYIPVVPAPTLSTPASTWPHFPHGVAPALNPPVLPGSVVPTQGREHYTAPAKVEFDDGTMLSGEIHSDSPLQCMALFGAIAIPFNQIKGIEWRSGTEQPDDQERTAIASNGGRKQ